MDSSSRFSELMLAPDKCRLLSVNEKKELVSELSKSPRTALERISKWTRHEIAEILCADIVRDIKFSVLSSKDRMLYYLFKAVNGEKRRQQKQVGKKSNRDLDANNLQSPCKIQRTNDRSSPLPVCRALINNNHLCQNSACRATLNPGDKFCRRCSCCICFKYDDDKDPSLWLFCTSGESEQGDSCGLSCHLECALKDERSGIIHSGQSKKLDGGYYCTHCGKQNDLLGCWKQQLLIAKTARRLNVLCYRIFLSHKILISTEKYLAPHAIVDTAVKMLEAEFGPITGISDVGHGIVGRFPVGVEVQKLCTCALETLQSMFSSTLTADLKTQRSSVANCDESTSKLQSTKLGDLRENKAAELKKNPRVSISALHEEQEIIRPSAQSALALGRSEGSGDKYGLPVPNSAATAKASLHLDSSNLILNKNVGNLQNLNADAAHLENNESGAQTESPTEINAARATSFKSQADCHIFEAGPSKPETELGNSSNKSPSVKQPVIGNKDARSEVSYEYCVKVIRKLECEGHIEAKFRLKFVTWFCLRATPHERRIVGAFMDYFIDDPISLASQLADTFSDAIYSRRSHPVPTGFCMELSH